MNQQDANRMLGAGLVLAVVSATLGMLGGMWNLMFVTGLGAACFLGVWVMTFIYRTGQEFADWIECHISDSLIWHAVILIGSCFPFVWLAITAKDELFSILIDNASLPKAMILASSIIGMTLITGMLVEFILIRHRKPVGTDEIDTSDLGNVVTVDFAKPR